MHPTPQTTVDHDVTVFSPEALPFLEQAANRLRRQKAYARPLSKGGARAAGLEDLLQKSEACLSALARPQGVLVTVPAEAVSGGVRIAGQVTLEGESLARDVAAGGQVAVYLLSLGVTQSEAFDWLEGDYVAHHVQSDLGSEMLFAFARHVFSRQRAELPSGSRIKRVSVQTEPMCGEKRSWDADKVQALLGVVDGLYSGANPGVSVTKTGCFQPLHSLLGLTIQTA